MMVGGARGGGARCLCLKMVGGRIINISGDNSDDGRKRMHAMGV